MSNNAGNTNTNTNDQVREEVTAYVMYVPTEEEANDPNYTKKCTQELLLHLSNLIEEEKWLVEGSKTMSPEFCEQMYRRVFSTEDFNNMKAKNDFPDPNLILPIMLRNRANAKALARAQIANNLKILKRQQDEASKRNKKNGDDNGAQGGAAMAA